MPKNKKKLFIGIFISSVFLIASVFAIISRNPEEEIFSQSPEEENIWREATGEGVPSQPLELMNLKGRDGVKEPLEKMFSSPEIASATILAGEITTNISFSPDTLFYDALVEARNSGQIELEGKNYPGLGFFVTDIGTLHSGNGKYLLYYINGKEATVGVSSYILKDGDILEWKLE